MQNRETVDEKKTKKLKLMLMRRATTLAVSIRRLSWYISSHFVAIHF